MAEQSVFLIFCELAGTSRPLRESGETGAFVVVLVPSNDIITAIEQARKALTDDEYDIADIDRALRFATEEWEPKTEIPKLVREVRASKEIRYSSFQVWGD